METYNKNEPYNQLPPLPPAATVESLPILRKAIIANKALAKLSGSAGKLPNESLLIHSILLRESKLSSEIENIFTTNDNLYQALSSDLFTTDAATKEVLHYNEALWEGYRFVREYGGISISLVERLFRIIKETDAGIRKGKGTTIQSSKTREVIYTPPEGEAVIRTLLANWEQYMHEDSELDALIRMAILHYQFEAIHPFPDGNGRTGRILNILFLIKEGLLDLPVLYLSKYIIEHKSGYYQGLSAVTNEGAWEPWIMYMLSAVEETARYTQQTIDSILALMDSVANDIRKKAPELFSKELVEVLFSLPYTKRKFLEEGLRINLKTAGAYLIRLEEAGILSSMRKGKEKLYINKPLLQALTKE